MSGKNRLLKNRLFMMSFFKLMNQGIRNNTVYACLLGIVIFSWIHWGNGVEADELLESPAAPPDYMPIPTQGHSRGTPLYQSDEHGFQVSFPLSPRNLSRWKKLQKNQLALSGAKAPGIEISKIVEETQEGPLTVTSYSLDDGDQGASVIVYEYPPLMVQHRGIGGMMAMIRDGLIQPDESQNLIGVIDDEHLFQKQGRRGVTYRLHYDELGILKGKTRHGNTSTGKMSKNEISKTSSPQENLYFMREDVLPAFPRVYQVIYGSNRVEDLSKPEVLLFFNSFELTKDRYSPTQNGASRIPDAF
ncbi:MAG: hypothetical protein K2X66_00835 [Cyanobacteria bacterium]|nr:hypothetical protein [Cyanobacteriota bacterium]